MMKVFALLAALMVAIVPAYGKTGADYPTLPTQWVAETIDPPMGKGIESYNFVAVPTVNTPSTMWSNYTGCQRLIYVENNAQAHRYLLGCDAVQCCVESQDGNQVEFQIPNVYYANKTKTVEISYARKNITNFGVEVEVDEWSWALETPSGVPTEKFFAYTIDCETCVNKVQLIQWIAKVGVQTFPIQFKGYKGIDAASDEGKAFAASFQVPKQCQANNILTCPDGLHAKYFGHWGNLAN